MTSQTPRTLEEMAIAIADLQTRTEWLQGQSNLLLGFVVANPQNLQAFANFATLVSSGDKPEDKEMRAVAQRILASGLAAHASSSSQSPEPPDGGPGRSSGSNVIQFPSRP